MKAIKSIYLSQRLLIAGLVLVALALGGFMLTSLYMLAQLGTGLLLLLVLLDGLLLFRLKHGLQGNRLLPAKFSNGDDNPVRIQLQNHYRFSAGLRVLDEAPEQFQARQLAFDRQLPSAKSTTITYFLRPVRRGAYCFGHLNVLVHSPLGLLARRYKLAREQKVAVYPSFLQMHKYELLAFASLPLAGIKKIRRIGHNQEFEQIKEYVQGDDYRTLNWRATARSAKLMVNTCQDERSQQLMCLVDKGRLMHMPFEGLSLLDWAINASLVISNIALKKGDKVGLLTFQHRVQALVKPSNRNRQMALLMEQLYQQKTAYKDTDYSQVYLQLRHQLPQRSLLLLFTNFESLPGMKRQLPYLQRLAKRHLLVVIFFENTELKSASRQQVQGVEELYTRTIVEKLVYEKRLIVKELQRHGIQALLTPPQQLTVNTINKYLELKARGLV